ncbi:MAG TPA: response regulator [Anaeromyxobacteraceae bacterium]|nr:response regulator [Anaeromyxobacteraceae bacterium]
MLRTMVVEDEFTSRRILSRMLAPLGTCDVATDGKEALEAFGAALQEGSPYDVMCLDITMPDMNGHDVLKRIREMEEAAGLGGLDRVKIIMTTASDDRANIMGAFRSECDAYLVKPIAADRLMSTLSALGLGV